MTRQSLSLNELRRASADVLRAALAGEEPVLLTHCGEAVGALVNIATLRRLASELDLLRQLSLGELESAGGVGHPLAEVLADCELLLEEN